MKAGTLQGLAQDISGFVIALRVGKNMLARQAAIVDGPGGIADITLMQSDTIDWPTFSFPGIITGVDTEGNRQNMSGIGLVSILPSVGSFEDVTDMPTDRLGDVTFDGSTNRIRVVLDPEWPTADYNVQLTTSLGTDGGIVGAAVDPDTKDETGFDIVLTTQDYEGRIYWRVK